MTLAVTGDIMAMLSCGEVTAKKIVDYAEAKVPVLQAFWGISHFVWYCKAVSDLS